jgi:hypothetical protein
MKNRYGKKESIVRIDTCLPGWKILVGPQEAADLESFVKSRLK